MARRKPVRKSYLDASVIIAFLKGEPGRCPIVTDILKAAEAGKLQVFTSAYTIAEVCRSPGSASFGEKESDKALTFFEYDFITLIDVDRRTGEQAHRFCVKYSLHPADAVHLASALKADCDTLWAWDDAFVKKSRMVKSDFPGIVIREPEIVDGQMELPDGDS
jgi:predicted nucleic acid-binding protein